MSSSDDATRTSRRRSVGRSGTDERIELQIDHDVLDVAPGGTVTLQVTVHNRGASPVAPHLRLTGLGGCEVSGATSLPPLGPGTSCRSELRLRLPDDAPAGQRRVALVVEDRTGRAAAAVAHVELRTGSAAGVSMSVSPRDPRGALGAKFKVNLHNQGDTTVQLALRGEGDGVKVRISRPEVTLPPGTHVRVRAKARATRPVVTRSRRLPFLVVGQGTTTPVTDAGTLQQSALFDGSMLKLVAIVLVLALWAAGAVAAVKTLTTTKDAGTAAPTTTIAAPSADPSATDGQTATDGAEGSGTKAATGGGKDGKAGEKDAKAADGKAPADAARPDTGGVPGIGAVIVGTVSGPSQVAGITVGLEKISLGDAPTKGSGKLPANSAATLQATVGEQTTTTDDSGRFRFSSGLVVPALYRITVVKPGFEQSSVVAELTSDKATIELSVDLKAARGRLSGVVRAQDGTPVTDAVVTVADNRITYTAVVASSGDNAGSWAIDGIATPGSYLVTVTSPGRASSSTAVTLDGGDQRSGVDLTMIPGAGTIRGSTTSRGKGVGGLVVSVRQLDGDLERSTTTLTQPSLLGQFDLPGLPLGRYTLTVAGDGWLTETSQVVLDSGELVVPVNDLRQSTATIQGRVLTEARTTPACQYPEPGYDPTKISAQPCGNVGVTVANDTGTYRTTSASGTGAFTVSGVPTGTYTVTLERYGYVSATLAVTVNAGDIATIGPDGPTGPEPVVLKLIADTGQGLAVIQGVLRDSTDPDKALQIKCVGASLTVRDSTDPLAEPLLDAVALPTGCDDPPTFVPAALSYIYQCSDAPGAGPRACYTDNGGIRVQGLAAGAKQFRFSAVGFDDTFQVVQIPLGGTTELGVVLMKPLATLQGQVSGPNGVPLDHARVMVVPTSAATVLPPVPEAPVGGWYACTGVIENVTRSGRCADTDVAGNYQFGRALRSADYQVYAPVGVLTDPDGDTGPPAVTLDHELRARSVTVTAGQSTPLDISLRRYGAVYGVVQTPGGNGGFTFVSDVSVKVETVTSGGTATDVTDDVRITLGTGAAAGSFRIDRLTTLEPSTSRYRITFSNGSLDPVEVAIPGGVPFNTELLRNLVMTSTPWTVTGKVTWKPNPAAGASSAITGASLNITGATSYRLFDAPPYREAVVSSDTVATNGSGIYPTGAHFVGPSVEVVVSAPGFASRTVTVNAPGGTVPDIVLEPLNRTLNGTFALSPAIDPAAHELVTPESIYPTLTVTARSQASGRSVSTTLTTLGAFTFFDLRPGDYTISISGPGVTASPFTATLPPSDADTTPEVTNRPIQRTGMIAVTVKHYVTSGTSDYGVGGVTVKASLNGSVVQQVVTCVDPTAVGGVPGCAAGTAVFRDLALGEYTLTATKTGWYDPSDPNGAADTDVHLGVGTVAPSAPTQAVTLPAMRPYGTVSGMVRGALVQGDTNGVPLAGATVTAVSTDLTPTVTVIGTSALDGTFTLSGRMPAGTYQVTVTMPKYTSPAAATVTVVDDDDTPVTGDIVLVATPSGLSGTVFDEGSTVQKDITVRIVELPSLTAYVTGANGTWSFPSLAPRSYTVEFTATDGRAPVSRLITLTPGTDQVLDIHMVGPSGSLYGVVTSTPVGGAAVPLAGATVTWTYKSVSGHATTDAGGSYSFDGVPVTVSPDTISLTVTASQHADAAPRSLTLTAGQRLYVAVALVPTGRVLDISVVDKADQHALSGVHVTATSGSTTQSADSDNTGKVSLTLTPGSWSLTTTLAGTGSDPHYDQTTAVAVTVPSPPTAMPTPKLSLTPWEGLSIVVTKRDHATATTSAASGATVVATIAGVSTTLSESSTAGTYKLRGAFGATTASVSVSLADYTTAGPTSVSIASGQIASQPMELIATPRAFDLTVSSSGTGTPALAGVAVSAAMTGVPTMTASGTTNSSGVVRLSLAPGAWTFTTTNADTVGHQNGSSTATVAVGPSATVLTGSLSLAEVTEAIEGAVLSTYPGSTLDVVLPGATVTATKTGGGTFTATSDTDGLYQVKVFAATGWSVNAAATGFNPPAAQTLTVTAGQVTPAADIRMERKAASISGTVSITGQAINGATVSYRPHGSTATPTTLLTKANGTYKINAVDPNVTWDVTFSSTVNNKVRQPVTYQVTATKNGDAITLNQTYSNSAGAITVNIVGRLQNQPTVAIAIPTTGPDVVVSNSTANLVDPISPTMTENTGTKAWSATVSDLPQSSAYTVTASATGFGRTDGTAGAVSGPVNLSSTTAATTLTLTPLPRPLTVTLEDADGTAVGNAELKLQGGGLLTSASVIGSTDANGQVTFPNVPVSFSPAAQYTVTLTGTAGIEGGTSDPFDVAFSATGSAATLTLKLSRLRATITGKALVTDASAAAMAATSVTAVAGSKTITLGASTTTGTYERMGLLPAAAWTVTATAAGYADKTATSAATAAGTTTTLAMPMTLSTRSVAVSVSSSDSGITSLTGLSITATAGANTRTASTTPAALQLEPGTWTITATADDHSSKSTTVTVAIAPAAAPSAVSLTLDPLQHTILVTLDSTDTAVTALAGITATKTSGPHAVISSSVNGNVLTLVVRTGTYGFTVSATGQRDGTLTFTAPLGSGVSQPSLTLKREKVTLTLTDSATTPAALAGATVTMDVAGTPVTLTESAGTPGTYEYAGIIAAGTYTITATASGYVDGTSSATVTAGAQVAKALALAPVPVATTTTTTVAATTSTTATATTATTADPGTTTATTADPGTTTATTTAATTATTADPGTTTATT